MGACAQREAPRIDSARLANALRMLAADAVERAKSGHPGAPLGMAGITELPWRWHLRYDPANPVWPNRDRFVLSNRHRLMPLHELVHLSSYDLPIDELRHFPALNVK